MIWNDSRFSFILQRALLKPDEGEPRRPLVVFVAHRCGQAFYKAIKTSLLLAGVNVEFETKEDAEQTARNHGNDPNGLNFPE